MNVIDKIRELQWERGWTDYKLAQAADISQSSLATLYSRQTPPKLEMLQRICEAFGITLSQFFLDDEQIDILSEREKQMISSFRKLTPPPRKTTSIDCLNCRLTEWFRKNSGAIFSFHFYIFI